MNHLKRGNSHVVYSIQADLFKKHANIIVSLNKLGNTCWKLTLCQELFGAFCRYYLVFKEYYNLATDVIPISQMKKLQQRELNNSSKSI